MKNKRWQKQSAQFQLTSRFVLILTTVLLVINLVFISVSFYSVYDYLANQAEEIVDTLDELPAETSDLESLANATIAKSDEDAIRFVLTEGPTYYSSGGKEIFIQLSKGTTLPIFRGIILAEDEIYYFYRQQQDNRLVEIAIHGNTVIEMLTRLIIISLFLNIFAILIGSLIIYFFVGSWSKTLQQMTKEMEGIEATREQDLLTIPETPLEIRQTATSFNHLLLSQRQAIARESQFVADASHELKTPLTAIRGHIQLIKRRGQAHPEVIPKSIDFIDKESKRLETLTNQLLILGGEGRERQEIDLSNLVSQEIKKIKLQTEQTISTSIESDVSMQANEVEFQQLCQNLLDNARKYSTKEDAIHVLLEQTDQEIIVEVQDTGIGIPDEMKAKIFERFFRVDPSRTSRTEGSGIGLAIVKTIVDKYQGEIVVFDNQPKGTIFHLKFPKK